MVSDFLESRSGRPWSYDREGGDFEFYQGNGSSSLEVVVVDHGERPTKEFLQETYSDRRGGRVNPILIVALYDDYAGLCGPSGEEPPVYRDVERGQADRVCNSALDEPDRHTAQQFLREMLPQLDKELTGLRNQGLLSTHKIIFRRFVTGIRRRKSRIAVTHPYLDYGIGPVLSRNGDNQ